MGTTTTTTTAKKTTATNRLIAIFVHFFSVSIFLFYLYDSRLFCCDSFERCNFCNLFKLKHQCLLCLSCLCDVCVCVFLCACKIFEVNNAFFMEFAHFIISIRMECNKMKDTHATHTCTNCTTRDDVLCGFFFLSALNWLFR